MSYHNVAAGLGFGALGALSTSYRAEAQFWVRVNSVPGLTSAEWYASKPRFQARGVELLQWPTTKPLSATIKVRIKQTYTGAAVQRLVKEAVLGAGVEVTSVGEPRLIAGSEPAAAPSTSAPPPTTPSRPRGGGGGGGGGSGSSTPSLPGTTPSWTEPGASDSGGGVDIGKIVLAVGGALLAGSLGLFAWHKLKERKAVSSVQALAANTVHRVLNPRRRRRRNDGGTTEDRRGSLYAETADWLEMPNRGAMAPGWLRAVVRAAGFQERALIRYLSEFEKSHRAKRHREMPEWAKDFREEVLFYISKAPPAAIDELWRFSGLAHSWED